MGDTDQPLKLIYAWKKMLSQYGPSSAVGKGEGELPTLYLWRNVFFPPASEQSVSLIQINNCKCVLRMRIHVKILVCLIYGLWYGLSMLQFYLPVS